MEELYERWMKVVDDNSAKGTPNYAGNIIYILAGLPEFLRKPMMRNRLSEFFTLQDDDKVEMIRNVVDALPGMDMSVVAKLFKTWLELLHELGDEKRRVMFSIYAGVMTSNAEKVSRIDFASLLDAFNSLDASVKGATIASIKHVLDSMDGDRRSVLLRSVPESLLREIGLA